MTALRSSTEGRVLQDFMSCELHQSQIRTGKKCRYTSIRPTDDVQAHNTAEGVELNNEGATFFYQSCLYCSTNLHTLAWSHLQLTTYTVIPSWFSSICHDMVWQRTGEQAVQKYLSTVRVNVFTAESHEVEMSRTGKRKTLFIEMFKCSAPFLFTANRLSPTVCCRDYCHNQWSTCIFYTLYYTYFIHMFIAACFEPWGNHQAMHTHTHTHTHARMHALWYQKMEALHSSEISVTIYELIWSNIPEDLNLHQHCCENRSYYLLTTVSVYSLAMTS
jgi:hypothetical protein